MIQVASILTRVANPLRTIFSISFVMIERASSMKVSWVKTLMDRKGIEFRASSGDLEEYSPGVSRPVRSLAED